MTTTRGTSARAEEAAARTEEVVCQDSRVPKQTAWAIPVIPGVLDEQEILSTAESIIDLQCRNGMIPWFDGGHCDPWNHIETAMALTATGYVASAEAAYGWLVETQLPEGGWFNYYLDGSGVKDSRLDTNVCAYIATGVWHHYVVTGDLGWMRTLWPSVDRALAFVLRWQKPDGVVRWSLTAEGTPESYALLTGSSSILHALRCGVAIAEALGLERPEWEMASARLAHAIAHRPAAFAPKEEFAMDWYYPVLAGALDGHQAKTRIDSMWDEFVMEGLGVRCVSTNPWVTAAETAECALALDAIGRSDRALDLLTWAQSHRQTDGSYLTGMVYPDHLTFPHSERTAYTAAAMILAADAMSSATPACGLFRGEGLPASVTLPFGDD